MVSYVITGGRGIGYEFINQLSSKPENTVFALVRKLSTVPKLQALIKARPNVHAFEADITDFPALKAAAAGVAKITGGTLDVLINNAAFVEESNSILPISGFEGREEVLLNDMNQSFNINVNGIILTTNAFLPLIRSGSVKKVITISSGMGDAEFAVSANSSLSAPYSISKAAVNMAVAKYAVDPKNEGLIFLALSPGLVDTATAPPTPEQLEAILNMVAGFKALLPEWSGQPIQPEESVSKMLSVIDNLTPSQNGAFLSHLGNKQWL